MILGVRSGYAKAMSAAVRQKGWRGVYLSGGMGCDSGLGPGQSTARKTAVR